jgi:redox-sensitive bicupin YhaK (pirin superfamily)
MNDDGDEIAIEALEDALILFGHARPLGEPVAARGPFVMNTREELNQAMRDYQEGKFAGKVRL